MKTEHEKQLNIPLTPEQKRNLKIVSDHYSRTQRKQAALYVAKGVERDIKRIEKNAAAKA